VVAFGGAPCEYVEQIMMHHVSHASGPLSPFGIGVPDRLLRETMCSGAAAAHGSDKGAV